MTEPRHEGPERYRVLVVEDEAVVAMDLEDSLVELGCVSVGIAETSDQALVLAERERPDLVLMDIQLRGNQDGIWTAEEIHRRWNIPSIFVTANTNNETVTRAKAAGPYAFLNKPFRLRELDAAITIAIHQNRVMQSLFAERSWFSTTMSSLTDGVIATDAEGHIRFLNPAAERLTGWPRAEAVGRRIEEVYRLLTLDGEEVRECLLRRAIATGEPAGKGRFLLRTREGGTIPVEDAAAPINEQEQVVGAVTTFANISDRLRIDQETAHRQELLEQEVDVTLRALGQTREELQALSQHLMVAQEQERRRIARELHDDLGQRVALLGLKTSSLAEEAPPALKEQLDTFRSDLRELAAGLRSVSHRLHPAVISDLGLSQALRALVREFKTHGLDISANVDEVSGISLEVATSLYRIAQESLQNVKKHAPNAPVFVTLSLESRYLVLRIEDKGVGFSPSELRRRGGLGLISMKERARLAGGTLVVSARPNEGTTLMVRVRRPAAPKKGSKT